MAVTETVTNVVRHAYRSEPGDVELTAAIVEDQLWVLITDEGVGHQTAPVNAGLGLGLGLIPRVADEFVLTERGPGGTEARMRFTLGPQASDLMG